MQLMYIFKCGLEKSPPHFKDLHTMRFVSLLFLLMVAGAAANAQAGASRDSAVKMVPAPGTDSTYAKVEVESGFPGGEASWIRFLNTHLVYPPKAVRKNIQGTVVLQFIVGKDGVLSDIEAQSGPDLLKEAALNVIKESPRWVPAVQNGKKVKSYKKQPITFRIQ
jgi:protein TonB